MQSRHVFFKQEKVKLDQCEKLGQIMKNEVKKRCNAIDRKGFLKRYIKMKTVAVWEWVMG